MFVLSAARGKVPRVCLSLVRILLEQSSCPSVARALQRSGYICPTKAAMQTASEIEDRLLACNRSIRAGLMNDLRVVPKPRQSIAVDGPLNI